MNRQEKEALVVSLKQSFAGSQASFVVVYRGLSVGKIQGLRRSLREKGSRMQVTKARFMKIAADGIDGAKDLQPFLKDQIGLVFASDHATGVAKDLCGFAAENKTFSVEACLFESKVFDRDAVSYLATLPPREVLLAQVASVMQMPSVKFVQILNMLIVRLLIVLKKIEEQKGS